MQSTGHVLIVGGGIVGLSTARALRRFGHEVTVIERGPVPNPLAASSDHHRLIRSSYADRPGYCLRIAEAFAAWRRMWADLGGPEGRYYAARGILTLSREAGDWGERSRRTMDEVGVPYEFFATADDLVRRFPHIDPGNAASGTLSEGGALMANRILSDLADWLRRNGAAVLEHSPVVSVDGAQGTVTLADGRVLSGDLVLVTAGTGTPGLGGALAADLSYQRTVIVYADPPAHLAEAFAAAPCWTDLGGGDDLWGMPPIDGLPLKLGAGFLGRGDPDDTDRTVRPEEVARVLDAYRGRFRDIDAFKVRFHQANYWMLAPEERFVLRRDDRLWVASACSGHGFKFGALSGEDIAAAISGAEELATVAERMAGYETAAA